MSGFSPLANLDGPGDSIGGVQMRRRWAVAVRGWLRAVGEGLEGEEALVRGAEIAGVGGHSLAWKRSTRAAAMEKILAHPDVKLALRGISAEAGFELPEAMELWAGHIRRGNYAALKDWLKAALPQEPKRVDVRSAHMTFREPRTDGSTPVMRARAVGAVVEDE